MLALVLAAALDLPTTLPPALMAQVQPAAVVVLAPDPMDIALIAGASISNLDSTHQASPFADVDVNFPIPGGRKFRGEVEGMFSGAPAPTTDPSTGLALASVSAFVSTSLEASSHFIVGSSVGPSGGRTTVGLAGGVTARFTGDPNVNKSPGHAEAFLQVAKKDHTARFRIGVGFTNETGDPACNLRVQGAVTVANAMRIQALVIAPFANAPSNWYQQNSFHPIRVDIAIGFDMDHLFTTKS
jgi:hypothetical protein